MRSDTVILTLTWRQVEVDPYSHVISLDGREIWRPGALDTFHIDVDRGERALIVRSLGGTVARTIDLTEGRRLRLVIVAIPSILRPCVDDYAPVMFAQPGRVAQAIRIKSTSTSLLDDIRRWSLTTLAVWAVIVVSLYLFNTITGEALLYFSPIGMMLATFNLLTVHRPRRRTLAKLETMIAQDEASTEQIDTPTENIWPPPPLRQGPSER